MESFLESCGCLQRLPVFELNEKDFESCERVDDVVLKCFCLSEVRRNHRTSNIDQV